MIRGEMALTRRVAALVFIAMTAQAGPSGIPEELVSYRSWQKLFEEPKFTSDALMMECNFWATKDLPPSDGARGAGPHGGGFVQEYANDVAQESLSAKVDQPFPIGTVFAKQKLAAADAVEPDGVAFMVKRAVGFETTGGWEFLLYPEVGKTAAAQRHCAQCHQAAKRDFVFYTNAPSEHPLATIDSDDEYRVIIHDERAPSSSRGAVPGGLTRPRTQHLR